MHAFVRFAPLLLAAAGAFANAEDLPKNLHGRWTATATAAGKPASQPFDLENIDRKDDTTFAARLSWTTADPRCTVRYVPMKGRITATGLSFDSVTKCDVPFSAELAPGQGGTWVGRATVKSNPPAVMELTAK